MLYRKHLKKNPKKRIKFNKKNQLQMLKFNKKILKIKKKM